MSMICNVSVSRIYAFAYNSIMMWRIIEPFLIISYAWSALEVTHTHINGIVQRIMHSRFPTHGKNRLCQVQSCSFRSKCPLYDMSSSVKPTKWISDTIYILCCSYFVFHHFLSISLSLSLSLISPPPLLSLFRVHKKLCSHRILCYHCWVQSALVQSV